MLIFVAHEEVVLVMLQGVSQTGVALFTKVAVVLEFFVQATKKSLVVDALGFQEIQLYFLSVTTQLCGVAISCRLQLSLVKLCRLKLFEGLFKRDYFRV